jgi:CheY-like chemotaxis protein
MKVLVIDDASAARTWACLGLLGLGGVAVCEAANGPDGIAMARRERPDAILLDVELPGLDGATTLAGLRDDPLTADIPVFLMVAQPSARERAELLRLGARSIFYKPFAPERLAADICALV